MFLVAVKLLSREKKQAKLVTSWVPWSTIGNSRRLVSCSPGTRNLRNEFWEAAAYGTIVFSTYVGIDTQMAGTIFYRPSP